MLRTRRTIACNLLIVMALLSLAGSESSAANTPESDLERDARLARKGAGFRVGAWDVSGLETVDGAQTSTSPLLESFFQKGMDRHLAWITNASIWWQSQTVTSSGGLGGGTSTEKATSYVVPLFTSLRLHPFTGPDRRFEPFIDGGAGVALGILSVDSDGSGLLGAGNTGTQTSMGFGFRAGTGFDLRLNHLFGVSLQGRYQWVRFSEALNADDTFSGFGVDLGLTYRFQY